MNIKVRLGRNLWVNLTRLFYVRVLGVAILHFFLVFLFLLSKAILKNQIIEIAVRQM